MIHEPLIAEHSAEVDLWLDCGEHGRLELGRVTPNAVIAKAPRDIPACIATLIVTVNGEEMTTRVNIANGFSKESGRALALPIDDIAPF